MADYKLTANEHVVIRTVDNASIPDDPLNRDYVEYLAWADAGGVPDPYVAPPPTTPTPNNEQTVLYEHENRLRVIEGQPPISADDFYSSKIFVVQPAKG